MSKIQPRNLYKPFSTNSGVCFLFQMENRILFTSSDMQIVNERVLKFEPKLTIGSQFIFNELLYEVVEINAALNLGKMSDYRYEMIGKPFPYNLILMLTLKSVN